MTSPIDIRVDMDGVPALMEQLKQAGGNMQPALEAGAQYLKSKVATYPRERHAPQPFVSDKQRRGFFAKLRAGEIDVPYVRGSSAGSQKLGQSWRVDAAQNDVIIGTRASYAPLVQSREDQTRYHALTGWKTAEDVAEDDGDRAMTIVQEMIIRDLVS